MSDEIKISTSIRINSFKRVDYNKLNSKQQENYNFAKASALFADLGFNTIRLTDDWQRADLIAHNPVGQTFFIQLKGRFTIDRKYMGKEIYVCFPDPHPDGTRTWYLYPHDELLNFVKATGGISTEALDKNGAQSRRKPSRKIMAYLKTNGYELGLEAP